MLLSEKDYKKIETIIIDSIDGNSEDGGSEIEYIKGNETLYIDCSWAVLMKQVELTRDEYNRVEYGSEIVSVTLDVKEFTCFNEDGDLTSCNLDSYKLKNNVEVAYR